MSSLDLASTVGTWVGAGLGLIALVGIVGPLLVWRASLTARNKALSRLDAGLADHADFVSKGVPFSHNVRLFRKVRAPDLSVPPAIQAWKPLWKRDVDLPHKASAGWVQLGIALRACGLNYERGDVLVKEDKFGKQTAVLQVSRSWLVIFGLIRRFGFRRHSGKGPVKRPKGLFYNQPVAAEGFVDAFVERPCMRRDPYRRRHDVSQDSNMSEEWATYDQGFSPGRRLEGLFGTLRFSARSNHVYFTAHSHDEIGGLSTEPLDVAGIFWLAVGCIPSNDGRVFCLDDVQRFTEAGDTVPEWEDSGSSSESDDTIRG